MANVTETAHYDDGKGRTRPSNEPKKSDAVELRLIENWEEVSKPGDYSFSCQIGSWGLEVLVMLCPFCGFEAPMPFLTKVEEKEPLTLAEEMRCGRCFVSFHVIKGKAIKSWFPGGIPCP